MLISLFQPILTFLLFTQKKKTWLILIIRMGGKQSTTITEEFENVQESIKTITQSSDTSIRNTIIMEQSQPIEAAGVECIGCDVCVKAGQSITGDLEVMVAVSDEMITNIKDEMHQAVDRVVAHENSQESSGLSFAKEDKDINMDMSTHIKNVIDENTTKDVFTDIITSFTVKQDQPITFTGSKVTCTMPGQIGIEASQDMQVDAVIQTYLSNIMEKLGETVMVQDTKSDETTTNTQTGGFDNWAFVVMIVVCVIVIGLVVVLMGKSGTTVAGKLANRPPPPSYQPAPAVPVTSRTPLINPEWKLGS